jgi:hypothetical protein
MSLRLGDEVVSSVSKFYPFVFEAAGHGPGTVKPTHVHEDQGSVTPPPLLVAQKGRIDVRGSVL